MKIILVTGTPGTGKTFLAKELSLLLHYRYIDGIKIAKQVSEGYDKIRRTLIVDRRKFSSSILALIRAQKASKNSPNGLVIDSHMSHFLPARYADLCVVTKCSLNALKRRLEARRYPAAKVRENLDAEIFDTCLVEAEELGHKVVVADTSRKAGKSLAQQIKNQLRNQS
ncbi:AAA family ATPase [Candidatus Woesearchaeota archaeon]|nr:AAA family ATPase [Candidatus Woesearchaeota archaeon]